MDRRSNLTDVMYAVEDKRSKLARLVDMQLEKRGICTATFTEDEKKYSIERERLGPKFYKEILEQSGIEFLNVFKYAACHLYDDNGAHLYAKHPAGVERLFEILTGEKEFVKAAQVFFMEVYPTHSELGYGVTQIFKICHWENRSNLILNDLKLYFALELTDEKMDRLEVFMEDANSEKSQRFRLDDQYVERQSGNTETINKLLENLGRDAREMVTPLILNELRVNSRDIFRYVYHKDLCTSMIWAGGPGSECGGFKIPGRLPLHRCVIFEECMKIIGVFKNGKNGEMICCDGLFWKNLQKELQVVINSGYSEYPFLGIETGFRGNDSRGNIDTENGPFNRYLKGICTENPLYLISSYGAEATKDRLDAIFTPEVLEVILEEYGFLTLSEREVEKKLKELRKNMQSEESPKETPKKKGLFGLFRKG